MAENLIAVWLDLECASGNDARPTESEIRVGAKIMPYLVAGSDLICSGLGSILKYDNSFNPSLLNGEELEDFLVLQRDFEADGGLTPIGEDRAMALRDPRPRRHRRRARGARPRRSPTPAMLASVATASGSNDTESFTAGRRRPHQRGDPRPRHHRHRRDPRAGHPRLPRGGREPARARPPAALRRLPADLGAGPRRPRPLRGQRPQRLPGPRHRLPRLARAPRRDRRHPRRARRARGAAQPGAVREGRGPPRPLPRARPGSRAATTPPRS